MPGAVDALARQIAVDRTPASDKALIATALCVPAGWNVYPSTPPDLRAVIEVRLR